MSEDGWQPLSPQEFAAQVNGAARAVDENAPLEERMRAAQYEGLDANIRRQLSFLGDPSIIEIQALKVRRSPSDNFERSRAAHGRSVEEVCALCAEADSWYANGAYLLTSIIKPGVETRHSAPGRWFDIPKGGGTTDGDVEARLVLPIDFDVKRSSGTSATDEELSRSVSVALSAWKFLSGAVGKEALAYLHSGNGRQIHIALDHLPPEETKPGIAGILAGLASIFNTEQVVIDETLCDAKRILPACGTLKKKGAPNLVDRPHRRTAIVTPHAVKRLSLQELRDLWKVIGESTDDAGRAAMEKAAGIKPNGPVVEAPRNPGSPFDLAKRVDPQRVARWLGLYEGDEVHCPGCSSTDGVNVIRYGLKCFHNRCKDRGVNGFYTTVDMVMTARSVTAVEAVKELGAQFGFDTHFKSEVEVATSLPSSNGFEWISTEDIFAPLPATKWLVKDLHVVAGRPTLLAGYGFSGKTLMAQSLAMSIAASSPVWGFFTTGDGVEVRHLDYEQGKHATLKRYQRLAIGHGISRDTLGSRLKVAIFPDVYLDTASAQDIYARSIEGVGVVILDALRGATPSIDENDSTIRRCLDNLTRVSEKTGTAFIVLHHAGKNRDEEGADPRKLPRGSSAIFDACGCVFTVDGERNGPKRVQQTKAPAEAEGGAIDTFHLGIEDVAVGELPIAGLRVVRLDPGRARTTSGASMKFLALKGAILEVVANTHGLTSMNSVCARVSGGSKDQKLAAIRELFQEGAIAQPGGADTPICSVHPLDRVGSVEPVPDRSNNARTGPAVPAPLRAGPAVPSQTHPPNGTTTGPAKAEEARFRRAAEAESAATELENVAPKEWLAHASLRGWSQSEYKAARALAVARQNKSLIDARKLAQVRDSGLDPQAWAVEHDWSDERTSRAMAKIDDIGP
jgi:hypothetical protein